jgi:hypothetical protein
MKPRRKQLPAAGYSFQVLFLAMALLFPNFSYTQPKKESRLDYALRCGGWLYNQTTPLDLCRADRAGPCSKNIVSALNRRSGSRSFDSYCQEVEAKSQSSDELPPYLKSCGANYSNYPTKELCELLKKTPQCQNKITEELFESGSSGVCEQIADAKPRNNQSDAPKFSARDTEEQAKQKQAELDQLRAEAEQAKRKQAELEAQLAAAEAQAQVKPAAPLGPPLSVHAIVIGNGAYQGSGRLENPINDARAISAKLKSMGFKVTLVENADRTKLVSSLVKFSASAADSDLTLFFYAGHGVQISGTNYVLPTDTNLNQIGGVALHGISLNSVVEQFLPGKTKLVFLDACRDNPLLQVASRSVSRGLAPISVSQGTLISYATKDGSVAADGEGKNSPFTKALLQHIDTPEDIAVVLRRVRDQVMRDTGGQQQPWEYGSLSGGSLILSAIRAK